MLPVAHFPAVGPPLLSLSHVVHGTSCPPSTAPGRACLPCFYTRCTEMSLRVTGGDDPSSPRTRALIPPLLRSGTPPPLHLGTSCGRGRYAPSTTVTSSRGTQRCRTRRVAVALALHGMALALHGMAWHALYGITVHAPCAHRALTVPHAMPRRCAWRRSAPGGLRPWRAAPRQAKGSCASSKAPAASGSRRTSRASSQAAPTFLGLGG